MAKNPTFSTFLWFDHDAEKAVEFYTTLLPNARITRITRWGDGGPAPKGSWQIIPSTIGELLGDADPAKARRVGQALMTMQKLDLAALQRAHRGD